MVLEPKVRFRFKFVVIAKKDTYVYLCVSLYYYYFGNVHLQLYLLMGTLVNELLLVKVTVR